MMKGDFVREIPQITAGRFTWTIENFSKLKTKKLYSKVFCAGGYKWRFLMYPKGTDIDYFAMYLGVADSATLPYGWSSYAQFSIAVVNQIDTKFTLKKDLKHQFNARHREWGFKTFMPLHKLFDPIEGYLRNDTCVVEADIAVLSQLQDVRFHSMEKPEAIEAGAEAVAAVQTDIMNTKVEPSGTVSFERIGITCISTSSGLKVINVEHPPPSVKDPESWRGFPIGKDHSSLLHDAEVKHPDFFNDVEYYSVKRAIQSLNLFASNLANLASDKLGNLSRYDLQVMRNELRDLESDGFRIRWAIESVDRAFTEFFHLPLQQESAQLTAESTHLQGEIEHLQGKTASLKGTVSFEPTGTVSFEPTGAEAVAAVQTDIMNTKVEPSGTVSFERKEITCISTSSGLKVINVEHPPPSVEDPESWRGFPIGKDHSSLLHDAEVKHPDFFNDVEYSSVKRAIQSLNLFASNLANLASDKLGNLSRYDLLVMRDELRDLESDGFRIRWAIESVDHAFTETFQLPLQQESAQLTAESTHLQGEIDHLQGKTAQS